MPNFRNFVILLFITVMLCMTLAACGKRAAMVSAPDDVVQDHFPLTYPDPATDPVANPAPQGKK